MNIPKEYIGAYTLALSCFIIATEVLGSVKTNLVSYSNILAMLLIYEIVNEQQGMSQDNL